MRSLSLVISRKSLVLLFALAAVAAVAAEPARVETDELVVTGSGWTLQPLANGKKAFANRNYVWADLPRETPGWAYTQTAGGEPAEVAVEARKNTTVYMACTVSQPDEALAGWKPVPGVGFRYTDGGRTLLHVYARKLETGEKVSLPQGTWAGGLLLTGLRIDGQLERLPYNNPGLTADLGVGLWAWPLPMDFDGDGDLDLVVSCPDKPYNGIWFFENPTGRTSPRKWLLGLDGDAKMPVFKAARWISRSPSNVQVSYVDGQLRVLTPGTTHPEFLSKGTAAGVKIEGLNANVHPNRVRANMWRYADYDGDGAQDLVIGVGDWTEYGWDNAYDASGAWTNGPLRGFVYVARNTGTTARPQYAEPVKVEAAGKPLEVFGWPSPNFADWDGDGDLDILCGEFLDGFTYFENTGSRTSPVYAAGRRLTGADGKPLVMDLQMITPVAIDWDGDGDPDLICGDEDGRVAFIENTGKLGPDRAPRFLQPRYFRQEAQDVKFGALVTPVGCDWDGDGDWDLICGNTAGYIAFVENLSGPGVEQPRWAEPKRLAADGGMLRILAGPNGSIQGPCEAKWGYTTQTVCDWDGDGLLDIVANSILGKVHWYRNTGTRTAPKLAAAQPVEVEWEGAQPALAYGWMRPEGKALLTQWRTTPVTVDWNKDGLVDLVMLDQEGYLAFFERAVRDGRRVLLHPKRIFCNEKGEPLQFNPRRAGGSGRRKICIVDWDGDGLMDILINSKNAEFWRQLGNDGMTESRNDGMKSGCVRFRNMGNLHIKNIEGHDVSPTVVDFDGNGIPDFVGGAEDGYLYYLRNPRAAEKNAQ
jgi:hypothetical protein